MEAQQFPMPAVFDWTELDRNPISPIVRAALRQALRERRAGRLFNLDEFVRAFVSRRSVLDVGMVEHDITHINCDAWLHRKICNWARDTLGVDILSDELELLREQGYRVVQADATSEVDLGQRFERVFMGEIIEHVDKPVALLKFAARHIEPDGLILATTPNPFWIRWIWENAREGTLLSNAEHVSWVSPSMALELGRRAGLELQQYWLGQGHSRALLKRPLHVLRDLIFGKNSELFTAQFLYIWRLPRVP